MPKKGEFVKFKNDDKNLSILVPEYNKSKIQNIHIQTNIKNILLVVMVIN